MHAIYGLPPADLTAIPPGAAQFSPQVTGSLALETRAGGSLESAVVLAPPGTLERRYTLALTLRALAADAPLTVLAPKDRGGSRICAELRAFGCAVHEEARGHYRICTTERPAQLQGIEDAVEAGGPRLIESLGLWSQPGVFSWDRIDAGSALLAERLPALAGKGADFGCGIGVLARAALASPEVTQLTLIDYDRRAVELARRNVDGARASVHWLDLRSAGAGASGLDFVAMNPPFHSGAFESQALGQQFIRRAHEALRPGGVCWLVANRHLPYEEILTPLFAEVALRHQAAGYKIYAAAK